MSEKLIYSGHDPFCIIYKLGSEHCNCSPDLDDWEIDNWDEEN